MKSAGLAREVKDTLTDAKCREIDTHLLDEYRDNVNCERRASLSCSVALTALALLVRHNAIPTHQTLLPPYRRNGLEAPLVLALARQQLNHR